MRLERIIRIRFSNDIKRLQRSPKNYVIETIRGIIDMIKLKIKIPQLRKFDEIAKTFHLKLKQFYQQYVTKVSANSMAISFESAVFLEVICIIFKPKYILDLGSGFSSLVFRLYKLNTNPKSIIWSIDDSHKWLEKSRSFLSAHNFSTENLSPWSKFIKNNNEVFDLIFYDLGNMKIRKEKLKEVLKLARSGSIIILDDIHKHHYRNYVRRILKKYKIPSYSLKFFTEDKFGRYQLFLTL